MKFMSFGGGVQTVALALMCVEGDYEMPDYAIFSDTQWETKSTYDYLKWFIPYIEKRGLKVITVTNGNIREDALNAEKRFATMPVFTDSPGGGMLRRQCTNEYKIQPVYREIRKQMGLDKGERYKGEPIELWLGISFDEMERAKENQVKWIKNKFPLLDMEIKRSQCLEYIRSKDLPLPPKSACIGCPFHSNLYWHNLKINNPEEFEDVCSFDESLRKHRVSDLYPVFLHRSMKPLREIDFLNGQKEFGFLEECDGYCGV